MLDHFQKLPIYKLIFIDFLSNFNQIEVIIIIYLHIMRKQDKCFLEAEFFPANQSNFKSVQKAPLARKNPSLLKSHLFFGHVDWINMCIVHIAQQYSDKKKHGKLRESQPGMWKRKQ